MEDLGSSERGRGQSVAMNGDPWAEVGVNKNTAASPPPIHGFSQAQILYCVHHPRLAESLDVEAASTES